MTPKNAFTLMHADSLIASGTVGSGTNLVPNPGFELGLFASWATSTNWTNVSATSVTPNGIGVYAAQAGGASKGQTATLESNRFAVSGSNDYICSIAFASPFDAPKRANNLKVLVRWWSAASGGSSLRDDTLWSGPVKNKKGGLRYAQKRLTAHASANYASFYIQNKYGSPTTGAGYGVVADEPFVAGAVTVPTALSALDIWEYMSNKPIGFENLKYSWDYRTGCKRMTFRLNAPGEYLWQLLQTALGHHVETHYEGVRVFGGMLWSMYGRVGGRDLGVSLDSLANFIKVPRGASFEVEVNAESIARYGRKDRIVEASFNTARDARAAALLDLAESAFPIPTAAMVNGQGDDFLEIEVMGYGATLQWVTDLPPVYVGTYDTSQILATFTSGVLGRRSLLGRFREDTPNDFIQDDYSNVDMTGITLGPLESTARRTSLDIYLDLVGRGTSNKRGIVAGFDAERKFFMHERPTALGYTRTRGADGKFDYTDPTGTLIPRPLVRCGVWVSEGAPIPSYMIIKGSDAARDPANKFITEVEYDHETDDVAVTFLGARRVGLDFAKAVRRGGRK